VTRSRHEGFLAVLAALLAVPAASQTFGASAGVALPVGGLAEHRTAGIRVAGSVYSSSGFVRGDVAGVILPGTELADASSTQTDDWRSVSIGANVLPVLARSETLRVRALAGLSAHSVSVRRGGDNPYGVVGGVQLGSVLERSWNGRTLTAEVGLHVVASDYGVGELEAATFVPLSAGIRW
jgi:hypothetical protein